MERQALRAVLLAFLVATVFASDASGSETEPDFTITISETGVKQDTEHTFSLGPSSSLRVVDQSHKAVLLPEAEEEAEHDSRAYVFENGQCNFKKTIAYRDAFPGYSQPLWVRSSSQGTGVEGSPPVSVAYYTFTNPPAEFLSKRVSFCVRFATPSAGTTLTTTTSPTTTAAEITSKPVESTDSTPSGPPSSDGASPPSGGDSDSSSGPSTDGSSGSGTHNDEGSPQAPPQNQGSPQPPAQVTPPEEHRPSKPVQRPENSLTEPPTQGDNEEGVTEQSDKDKNEELDENNVDSTEHGVASPEPEADSEQKGPESDAAQLPSSNDQLNQNESLPGISNGASPTPTQSMPEFDGKEQTQVQTPRSNIATQRMTVEGAAQNNSAAEGSTRLRRLSDADTSAVKYLTIVVHSAACGLAAATLSASAALLSILASLLSTS
ncbi:Toxoplasma gondii family A protein [Toxoplasma gondii MAS]|uniref:Toxoplasma gondii family A protein n=2 Tax=Toxoplasma gondii TaxID=5811 RepID=A0A086QNN4_TOXGO|nr:Toxoplasma gondii family A protein [Toxoplasma gondii MAS]PUA87235.1 toxoplasma gondii family A protein [Toxoplasma gondii TgCATBr9]